jgi:hypothetical protein
MPDEGVQYKTRIVLYAESVIRRVVIFTLLTDLMQKNRDLTAASTLSLSRKLRLFPSIPGRKLATILLTSKKWSISEWFVTTRKECNICNCSAFFVMLSERSDFCVARRSMTSFALPYGSIYDTVGTTS